VSAGPEVLREILAGPGLVPMPCCFDALSARLVERAGFRLTFMSGFSVAAARLALPDAGLISFGEMRDAGRDICGAVSIPVIGDGDTGHGGAPHVKRTVVEYARAGFAGVMIEDQVFPKRCGHTEGKGVVPRPEALARIRAAVDARDEGAGALIVARTDARATHGLDEAIWRGRAFADLGADVVFVEAPASEEELRRVAREVPGPKLVNLVEDGVTPIPPVGRLEEMGYRIAAWPVTLLSAATRAMEEALEALAAGRPAPGRLSFEELKERVGFPAYDAEVRRYAAE